jgi:hypothetical protein
MLEVLRHRAAAAGVANLACVQAGFLSYQHPGPPADRVYTRNALHQLPDFWKAVALDRIGRMLRPQGSLSASTSRLTGILTAALTCRCTAPGCQL